jgi:SAM-dependent methyltransferase
MVNQYNISAEKEGFTLEKMHAIAGDLLDPTDDNLAAPDFYGFDFAIMSMALHHVSDPNAMITRLAERLGKGGVLVIIDFVAASESGCNKLEGPSDHPVKQTVTRAGFEEKGVKQAFEKAGLKDWGWKWFSERTNLPEEFGGENQLFLARGVKA